MTLYLSVCVRTVFCKNSPSQGMFVYCFTSSFHASSKSFRMAWLVEWLKNWTFIDRLVICILSRSSSDLLRTCQKPIAQPSERLHLRSVSYKLLLLVNEDCTSSQTRPKFSTDTYAESLLPRLNFENCKPSAVWPQTMTVGSIIITTNCRESSGKDEWLPNLSDHNPLDYEAWELCLNTTRHFIRSRKTLTSWRLVLQLIWDQLLQVSINKAILGLTKNRTSV